VVLPRILYAIDVWYDLMEQSKLTCIGKGKVNKQTSIMQRTGALAITRVLRSSPTDRLDANAFLIPAPLIIDNWQHRALVRMLTLPPDHPQYDTTRKVRAGNIKRHKAPQTNY
jgi:hypothetical protein